METRTRNITAAERGQKAAWLESLVARDKADAMVEQLEDGLAAARAYAEGLRENARQLHHTWRMTRGDYS